MKVAVYCSSKDGLAPDFYVKSREFAELLAKRGHSLVYGGTNRGIMRVVAETMHREGGKVIAVVPEVFNSDAYIYKDADVLIKTPDLNERKEVMERECDAMVILPGGIGTFDELFEAYASKFVGENKWFIGIYNMNGYYDKLKELLDHTLKNGFMDETAYGKVEFFDDPLKLIYRMEEYNNI